MAKARMLAAVLAHVAEHGLGDLSLRGLAAGIGTSHRMLIYHFGSMEQLLVEIVQAMEKQQRAAFADLLAELEDGPPIELLRAFWRRLADPALGPHERLFFELYGQALQGRPGSVALLDGIVSAWVEPMTVLGVRHGLAPETARSQARLGLAVTRGLLLDLLATGDRAAVDEAAELFFADCAQRF
jgi:AcrR family transcriptional regulator